MIPFQYPNIIIIFFFREKNTHTQERRKMVLTQSHTTTPLKSYGNPFKSVDSHIQILKLFMINSKIKTFTPLTHDKCKVLMT